MLDFLQDYASSNNTSFHMPGHKGAAFYKRMGYGAFLDAIANYDITEIHGADNLFQPEGIISALEEKYARLYRTQASRLLVNGSSGGLIAAILTSVSRGGKLIMARNSHKSIFNALMLGDIHPVFVYPEIVYPYGIAGSTPTGEIQRLLDENPDAEAVILPSPNYYGLCSDIKGIADIVHDRKKLLIVDQAHGAHLSFFKQYGQDICPISAEEAGADITVNSTHKTLASFTQSAVFNVNSNIVDLFALNDMLQIMQSSSPSYLLMASLDINADIIRSHGQELFCEWAACVRYFYENAHSIDQIHCLPMENLLFDRTKLLFSMDGFSGAELEKILRSDYGIYIELSAGDLIMCMTGIGTTFEHIDRLINALNDIAEQQADKGIKHREIIKLAELAELAAPDTSRSIPYLRSGNNLSPAMQTKLGSDILYRTRDKRIYPLSSEKKWIPLVESAGYLCAANLTPHPPGIPVICMGEIIDSQVIEYVQALLDSGETVIGLSKEGEVLCCKLLL